MCPYWLNNYKISVLREKYKLTGSGIKIAILDSGIDHLHSEFRNGVKDKQDLCYAHGNPEDIDGHGTHLAGIIGAREKHKGLAPRSDLYIGRIMTESWIVSHETVTRGIYWAIEKNVDIITICCGFKYNDKDLSKAIIAANNENIIIVASIGNKGESGESSGTFPARYEEVIGVGSVNENSLISTFTDMSSKLDILAPGENIHSAFLNGTYQNDSGTSQASAFLSGFLCLMLEWCKRQQIPYDTSMIKEILYKTGEKSNHENYRIIDPLKVIEYLR